MGGCETGAHSKLADVRDENGGFSTVDVLALNPAAAWFARPKIDPARAQIVVKGVLREAGQRVRMRGCDQRSHGGLVGHAHERPEQFDFRQLRLPLLRVWVVQLRIDARDL